MMGKHYEDDQLRCFVSGELPSPIAREIACHLLRGCDACQEAAQRYWYPGPSAAEANPPPAAQPSLGTTDWAALARTLATRQAEVDREKAAAPPSADRLLDKPLGSRMMMARNCRRYRTWAVVEELLERSYDLRFDDVHGMVELAQSALACAEQLDDTQYGRKLVADLRARCWSHLGNGLGILHEFAEAEACHERARAELEKGSGDPLELAQWLKLQIGLRIRQDRFDDAAELAGRYLAIAQRIGDRHATAEAKNLLGTTRAHQGRVGEAIDLLEEGRRLFEAEGDDRAVANSLHNLVAMLDEAGRREEALAKLAELSEIYRGLGDRIALLRLRVTEGEIAAGSNNRFLAERAFLEARNGFVQHDLPVEAAEATLELSLVYLEDGRFEDTRRLANQMVPIFQSRGLEREAIAALLIFREAALRETVTKNLVAETLNLVRSVQNRPARPHRSLR